MTNKTNKGEEMSNRAIDYKSKTIKLLQSQHDVLVDVINWLDSNKFSNTKIRESVDLVLNHSDFYEIKQIQEDKDFLNSENKKELKELRKIAIKTIDTKIKQLREEKR